MYSDGTTDTTRTAHFGNPTAEEKDAYTRVLLGNLDVERVVFPNDGSHGGADIDILARRHLWAVRIVYFQDLIIRLDWTMVMVLVMVLDIS